MPTYTDFNPYLDIPAGAARSTARTVPGSDPVTIPGSSPQPSADYELQDYFDDTGVPVRYLFFLSFSFFWGSIDHECPTRRSTPLCLGYLHILTSCWQPPHRLSLYSSNSVTPSPGNSTHNLASQPAAPEEPLMAPSGPNYYEYGWTQDNRWLEKQEAATKRSKRLVSTII
jgi:hypothetical protein